jgi:hypothetical protein
MEQQKARQFIEQCFYLELITAIVEELKYLPLTNSLAFFLSAIRYHENLQRMATTARLKKIQGTRVTIQVELPL